MTDKIEAPLSGEARLKQRRNRLFRFSAIGFVIAMGAGFASGHFGSLYSDGELPGWAIIALWLLAVTAFTWFAITYFRKIDELDLMDNLWATMVAFYFYVIAYVSWQMANEIGMLVPPNSMLIFASTMIVLFVAYFARKLGLR